MSGRESDGDFRGELARLARRLTHVEDVLAIQKLQSRYAHYLFTQRFERIVEECLAREAEDVSVEFSDSGVYRGLESIRALYRAFEATRRVP
jgi:hypothetical protein